jgi:Protein of unknown function (DUF2695)
MAILERTGFFTKLDDRFAPITADVESALCWGDYRAAKAILPTCAVAESEWFDVFHVLMAQGGFCDCEILYNVVQTSRFAQRYWETRARKRPEPHGPGTGGAA